MESSKGFSSWLTGFFLHNSNSGPRLRKWLSLKIRTANEESGAIELADPVTGFV